MTPRDVSTRLALCALVLAGLATPAPAGETLHHDLSVTLEPATHGIHVSDRITLPAELLEEDAGDLRFVLHGGLRILEGTTGFEIERLPDPPNLTWYGINEGDPAPRDHLSSSTGCGHWSRLGTNGYSSWATRGRSTIRSFRRERSTLAVFRELRASSPTTGSFSRPARGGYRRSAGDW